MTLLEVILGMTICLGFAIMYVFAMYEKTKGYQDGFKEGYNYSIYDATTAIREVIDNE